ncbi:MAG TPA: MHYT domain-containing protein [Rhizomicrobium sp.]
MLQIIGCITQQHDPRLVALAGLLCFFACVTAMSMVGRARAAAGRAQLSWLGAAGVVAGCGIWATHFVAMLAYEPGMPMGYDAGITILSALIAIVLCSVGYWIALKRPLAGGATAGAAIAAMHYVGMAALRLPADAIWNAQFVIASAVAGISLMAIAMRIAMRNRSARGTLAGAGLFTIAIVVMHFTGMTAVTFRPDPRVVVPNALVDPATLAIAIAAVAFLIIALGLVGVLVDNHLERLATGEAERLRGEINERRAVERELLAANAALNASQSAIRNLLDNADQGFFTVGPDLVIGARYSAACETILGETPAEKSIVDLLCRDLPADAVSALRTTLQSVFQDTSDYVRDLKLGLLPVAFNLGEKSLRTSYKFLAEDGRLMVILTDATETVQLTGAVERERKRLEMLVAAFTEGDAFSALVNDYRTFVVSGLPSLLSRTDSPDVPGELFRHVHTYKGLLAQFSFERSPKALHDAETELTALHPETRGRALTALHPPTLLAALEGDLESISDALGADFVPSSYSLTASPGQLRNMKAVAQKILAGREGRAASMPLRQLLLELAALGSLDAKRALALHCRGALSLAERLQKQVMPIAIEGDDARLPPETYGEFFRSLVHVFRNAVDHGIETPEERVAAGKPAEGKIGCHIERTADWLQIVIEDDGRGIDQTLLENRLGPTGSNSQGSEAHAIEQLVFREGLSSRDSTTEISGRGIGLAAVKTELDRLGGSVVVASTRGAGTRFCFRLPIGAADALIPRNLEAVSS